MALISMTGNKRINLEEWYTHEQALAKLTENAGRTIDRNYPRTLAKYGHVDVLDLGKRTRLYRKRDIDAYHVSTTPGRRPAPGGKGKGKNGTLTQGTSATDILTA